jgi:hypothetical protein
VRAEVDVADPCDQLGARARAASAVEQPLQRVVCLLRAACLIVKPPERVERERMPRIDRHDPLVGGERAIDVVEPGLDNVASSASTAMRSLGSVTSGSCARSAVASGAHWALSRNAVARPWWAGRFLGSRASSFCQQAAARSSREHSCHCAAISP